MEVAWWAAPDGSGLRMTRAPIFEPQQSSNLEGKPQTWHSTMELFQQWLKQCFQPRGQKAKVLGGSQPVITFQLFYTAEHTPRLMAESRLK